MCTAKKLRRSIFPSGYTLLLLLAITLPAWIAPATTAAAGTYIVVNDSEEVPVRSGQGTEYKIVALLKNGETVISLEETEYWIRIRTSTGREGWMLKRYLSSAPSIDNQLSLPIQNNTTSEPFKTGIPLNEPVPASSLPNFNLTTEKTGEREMESQIPHFELKQKEQIREIEELKNKLAALTKENEELRQDEQVKWFLAGGGVLVVGWILGLISGKARRRKPSLL
jgi:SH3 domain protein